LGDEFEDYSKIVRQLKAHVRDLEKIQERASSLEAKVGKSSDSLDVQDIISRINRVQDLVDRIEIEVDKLEMRVSSIEHVGFRLRTGGP
jgi:cell division protein FtsB